MFYLLYKHTDKRVFDDFPKISYHFPKISENFSKLFVFLCSPEVERISTPCFLSTLALGFRKFGKFRVASVDSWRSSLCAILSSSLDSVESLSECCILWTTGLGAIGAREEVEVLVF